MPLDPGPFDLTTTRVILGAGGDATTKSVTPDFYAELDAEFDGFAGCVLISKHEFAEAWPTWEIHPKGDEFVYLIHGDIDFVLWVDDTEHLVHVNQPGTYIVVPQAIWHTARPRKPTRMLFLTPGEGTLNAEVPGGPLPEG